MLKLSEAYETESKTPELELLVTVYNINLGHSPELLDACRLLLEYAKYVAKVREYAKKMPFADAVNQAVNYCMKNGILAEFLLQNKAEVIEISIFEYNEELHLKEERKFGWEQGWERGLEQGLERGIQVFVLDQSEENIPKQQTLQKLQTLFGLTPKEAAAYYGRYARTSRDRE